jgi:hypothetical protein
MNVCAARRRSSSLYIASRLVQDKLYRRTMQYTLLQLIRLHRPHALAVKHTEFCEAGSCRLNRRGVYNYKLYT